MGHRFISIVAVLAAFLTGCADAEPSDFTPPDAGAADVGSTDVDPHAACRACLEAPDDSGPGCAGALTACMTDPRCPKIYECSITKGCYALESQPELITCGFPCFTANQVGSTTDPVVPLAWAFGVCALGVCKPACSGGANP